MRQDLARIDHRSPTGYAVSMSAEVVAELGAGDYAMLSRLNAGRTSTPTLLGDLPVVVLTCGLDASLDQQAAHMAIAKLSRRHGRPLCPGRLTRSTCRTREAVITAILDVVGAVRERRPLR